MPYDFIICYRTGVTNPVDIPLRRPDYQRVVQSQEEETQKAERSLLVTLEARVSCVKAM